MSNLVLYLIAVVIWGSTWLAIKFQLGAVGTSVSVAFRFGLSALILFAYAAWQRSPLKLPVRLHAWLALQGLLLFGVNYVGNQVILGNATAVPEPSTYAMLAGLAALGLAAWHRRRRTRPGNI